MSNAFQKVVNALAKQVANQHMTGSRQVRAVLSSVWKAVSKYQQGLYDSGFLKRYRLPVPVISVGNVSVGGSGKTPMVELLIRLLENRRVAVLSRGYGGDESEQLRNKFPSIGVFTGPNRGALGYALFQNLPFHFEIAILDDAFQHWSIHRDIDIVMVNALHGMHNAYDNVVPLGLLRETWVDALRRADIVAIHHANLVQNDHLRLITKRVNALSTSKVVYTGMRPVELIPFANMLCASRVGLELAHFPEINHVQVFSGVGCGESFQKLVQQHFGNKVEYTLHTFGDHHDYTEKDYGLILSHEKALSVFVTTEKDFYRAPEAMTRVFQGKRAFCLCAELYILPSVVI